MKPVYKLGRLPHDPLLVARCLQAHDVLNLSTLPATPAAFDWSMKGPTSLEYPMLGNNKYGDCVPVGACACIETWSGQTSVEQVITEAEALDAYHRFTGFDPVTGAGDDGANMLDFMTKWKTMPVAGHKIKGFVAVDTRNLALLAACANLFGCLMLGWDLPLAWQQADVWDIDPKGSTSGIWTPGSWGGHCTANPAWSPQLVGVETWTEHKSATVKAVPLYCPEAYAPVSEDTWAILQGTHCPSGVDVQKLMDLLPVVGN